MSDSVTEKYRAWERQDKARWLLWGALGIGLLAASAAIGAATLLGVALAAGGVIAGVKAAGEMQRARAVRERIDDREALRDMRRVSAETAAPGAAAALPCAPETVQPLPATPESEAGKSWTATVTEKPAPAAGRAV